MKRIKFSNLIKEERGVEALLITEANILSKISNAVKDWWVKSKTKPKKISKKVLQKRIAELTSKTHALMMKNLAKDTMDTASERAWFIDNYDRDFDVQYNEGKDWFIMESPAFSEWSAVAPAFKRTIASLGFELIELQQFSGTYSSRMITATFKIKDWNK